MNQCDWDVCLQDYWVGHMCPGRTEIRLVGVRGIGFYSFRTMPKRFLSSAEALKLLKEDPWSEHDSSSDSESESDYRVTDDSADEDYAASIQVMSQTEAVGALTANQLELVTLHLHLHLYHHFDRTVLTKVLMNQ